MVAKHFDPVKSASNQKKHGLLLAGFEGRDGDPIVIVDSDNPKLTNGDFAKARLSSEVFAASVAGGLVGKRGRRSLAQEERKQKANIRLSPDVLNALRTSGAVWQARVDDLLLQGLQLDKS